jgi:hypothetical protein
VPSTPYRHHVLMRKLYLLPVALLGGFGCGPGNHEPTAADRLACERYKQLIAATPTRDKALRQDAAAFERYGQVAQAARESLLKAHDRQLKEVGEQMGRQTEGQEEGGLLVGAEGLAQLGEACDRAGVHLF